MKHLDKYVLNFTENTNRHEKVNFVYSGSLLNLDLTLIQTINNID